MANSPKWTAVKLKELDAFREARSLTAAQLAKLLGVTPSAVHNWQSGRSVPTRKTQEKLRALIDRDSKPEPAKPAEQPRSAQPVAEAEAPEQKTLPASAVTVTGRITEAYLTSHGKRMDVDEVAQLVARVRRALR